MTDTDALATRIKAAYTSADLTAFGVLLADDVRWGDDDHPNRCRSREDVLATFHGWLNSGVTAEVTEVQAGPDGVMCGLHVRWLEPEDRQRGVNFLHVFLTRDGLIREILRYNDRSSAARAIGAR